MKQRRLIPFQALWLKAIVPGSIASCLLFAAWSFGCSGAFNLHGLVLLTMAWAGGVAWACRPESVGPTDTNIAPEATGYRAELCSLGISIETQLAAEIAGIRTEVLRARTIVREATEGLNQSFLRLRAHALQSHNDVCLTTQHGRAGSGRQASPASADFERLENDIAQAIRCLQFEDIVTQSLAAADDHLLRLNEFETLVRRALELRSGGESVQLEDLKSDIEDFAVTGNVSRKVAQDSMAGGDTELF